MNDQASKNISPQCGLCHQDYDLYYHIPRVVPKCGHTFCEKCIILRLAVKSNRRVYLCNDCGSEVVIRKNVAEDVPKNVVIIDMIKNLKKYTSNEREEEKRLLVAENCSQHGKAKELVCQTCNFKRICSHCALFGEHKGHIFCKEIPANKANFNELKESFKIISDSVENYLLPNGQFNIKNSMKNLIIEGLQKQVTFVFKQFYEIIQKREVQMLQECQNIMINEGGIDKNIETLIKQYDRLRSRYDAEFKIYTQPGFASEKGGIGLDSIEQFLAKCDQLHKNLQMVQKHAKDHTKKIVKDVGIHIAQAGLFKIQEIPFSLKRVIENMGCSNSDQITSPNKRARLKSANSEAKPKSIQPQNNNFPHYDRGNKSYHKTTNTFNVQKKSRDSLSQVEKRDLQSEDFSILQPGGYSQFASYKQHPQKQLKQAISKKNSQQKALERGSLPPKANKPKVTVNFDSQNTNFRSIAKQQNKKSEERVPRSPARTITALVKSSKSILNVGESHLTQDLKYVSPSKSISAQLMSKLQELISEVDRQALNSQTLELNSADLTDTLLLYVIDYLRTKKYLFQVIKLVKNLISDEGLKILLSYLISDNCTQVLNFTSNHLTVRSIELILLFAAKNNILRTIYLSNNKISSLQIKARKAQLTKYQLEIIV